MRNGRINLRIYKKVKLREKDVSIYRVRERGIRKNRREGIKDVKNKGARVKISYQQFETNVKSRRQNTRDQKLMMTRDNKNQKKTPELKKLHLV